VNVFYRNQPLQSLDDKLYLTNLFNIGGSSLCISGLQNKFRSHSQALSELVNHLWAGEFNRDLDGNFGTWGPASIEEWEELSQADPQFVLKVNWRSSDCTVRSLLGPVLSYAPHANQLGNLILSAR
jgi:hypothetical protein